MAKSVSKAGPLPLPKIGFALEKNAGKRIEQSFQVRPMKPLPHLRQFRLQLQVLANFVRLRGPPR